MDPHRDLRLILSRAREYQGLQKGEPIQHPTESLAIGRNVSITNQAIKHIVEQRGEQAEALLEQIPSILSTPTKIADNSSKRASSLVYVKMNGKARAVVLEITKTPDGSHQVVSAFPMHKHTYEKLVDISGGPHVPSLDIA